jgi:hypothetical protein
LLPLFFDEPLDIFAHGKMVSPQDKRSGRWVASTKLRTPPLESVDLIYYYGQLTKSTPWLVVLDDIAAPVQAKAKELKVLFTNSQALEELKRIINLTIQDN